MRLESWEDRPETVSKQVLAIVVHPDYLLSNFSRAGAPPVNLYVPLAPRADAGHIPEL